MKKNFTLVCMMLLTVVVKAQVAPGDTVISKILQVEEERSPSAPAESNFNNIIRWNFFEMGRGIFSLGYERRLNNYFSIDVQLGYSTHDYAGDFTNNIFDDNSSNSSDDGVFPFASEGNSYKSYGSFCYMLGIRIYPFARGNMEGFYIEPHYYSKKWDYDKTIDNDSYYAGNFDEPFEKLTYVFKPTEQDLGIKCGWQFQGGNGRITINPYVGLLYRIRNSYSIDDYSSSFATQDDYYHITYSYKKIVEKKKMPGLVLGLNFGVAF